MHHCGPCHIELHGDVAAVETCCILLQQMTATVDGVQGHRQIVIPLRYVDPFEKRDGAWRIVHRIVVYEQLSDEPLLLEKAEGQRRLGPQFTQAQRSKDDPIFSILHAMKPA
ncbi:nuclear transport factor 2 family protein [Pelagibius sp.]|uniref:nuclear transport factor 2 family protein n=1 Tax=Pelagibius sp. TaxID=1931238 RepID=UPI003BB02236